MPWGAWFGNPNIGQDSGRITCITTWEGFKTWMGNCWFICCKGHEAQNCLFGIFIFRLGCWSIFRIFCATICPWGWERLIWAAFYMICPWTGNIRLQFPLPTLFWGPKPTWNWQCCGPAKPIWGRISWLLCKGRKRLAVLMKTGVLIVGCILGIQGIKFGDCLHPIGARFAWLDYCFEREADGWEHSWNQAVLRKTYY